MKKILLFLIVAGLATGLGSCKKFLEEKPYSFLSPKNFPTNEAEADIALRGIYAIMQGYNEYEEFDFRMFDYLLGALLSENNDILNQTYIPINVNRREGYFEPPFQGFYVGINGANTLIEALGDMDESWVPAKVAEAKAIRAYYYFWLVRMFSDVPLKLTATADAKLKPERTPVPEIYKQIVADLKEAEDKLPNVANGDGRITKGACKGILVQVYMSMAGSRRTPEGVNVAGDPSNLALARAKAKEVLEMGIYKLADDYTQLFKDLGLDVYNPEMIFDVPFTWHGGGDTGATFPVLFGPEDPDGGDGQTGGGKYGSSSPLVEWLRELEPNDERVPWNIADYYYITQTWIKVPYTDSSEWTIAKYRKLPDGSDEHGFGWATFWYNFPLVRLADIKLLYAEAINEIEGPTAEAYKQVNDIRFRAGLPNLPANLSKAAFKERIMAERAIEFVGEGQRHFDLVRWGNYKQKMDSRILSPWVLDYGGVDEIFTNAPLPQRELDLNGWSQNK